MAMAVDLRAATPIFTGIEDDDSLRLYHDVRVCSRESVVRVQTGTEKHRGHLLFSSSDGADNG